jgi:uncharacterized coiled-coil protein SlyX
MLRDLHAGATIHILNRKENTITQAEVLQVTPPAPQFNLQVTPQGVMPPRQVLSMRIKWNGREVVLNNLYADLSAAESQDGNGIVVCQDEAALLNELKSSKANVDYLIANADNFKRQSEWYDEQITKRDPVRNAEMQSAKQVEAIKNEFSGILAEQNSKIEQLTALLQQALNGGNNKRKD